jgi:hypothetical protein
VRTTLDIDDDVLFAAKERARRERRTAGEVISELARAALCAAPVEGSRVAEPEPVYGFRPFPGRAGLVTNEMIDELRDEDAY